jgi:hypothetical protein
MDATKEWQRLQARYAAMGDEELMGLREDYNSLTDVAQEILRDELRKRKMPDPTAGDDPGSAEQPHRLDALSTEADESGPDLLNDDGTPQTTRSYTWKTTLATFPNAEDAWMANEALKEAGIESWLQVPRNATDPTVPIVRVAADDLERAAAVLAKPIPEDIRATANAKIEDFEPPHCPRCRAEDPLLESADPSNRWSCEVCGHTWQEEIPTPE